ncbi:MAG: hypothetical protein ACTHN5_03660 [Phycisphaerae bacterium]
MAVTESDWQPIGTLVITSGKVALLDPGTFDATDFQLPRGEYAIQIKTVKYSEEQHLRVSRLRAAAAPETTPGKPLGTVGTDVATLAVVDANALHPDFSEEWKSHSADIENTWQSAELHAATQWGDTDDATVFFTTTGFGDGTFTIQELLSNDKRAGFEVEFIKPGTPYPFKKK